MKKGILLVAGTRPNFIKLAPLFHRLKSDTQYAISICHTGQHFDFNMSDIFWKNLELPEPHFRLDIKGDGVVDIIGKTILGINDVIKKSKFDLVIVFGDVNATVAGAITAVQSGLKLMHVEAGLRSFDRSMPEEINRVITDHVADYLMVSEESGLENLKHEGFKGEQYYLAGNIMIESLIKTRDKWEQSILPDEIDVILKEKPVVFTFHRPENVDSENTLKRVIDIILAYAKKGKVIFPVHPRTKAKMLQYELFSLVDDNENIFLTEPLSYFSFLRITLNAGLVITDSGGIQEETSYLRIPCVTFRKNTERPITVTNGTNLLLDIWDNKFEEKIAGHIEQLKFKKEIVLPFWDGEVSMRIVKFIKKVI
jgi:UDP-N-acetylglucosamine 2-epimerase (non-hydrolysing)